MTEHST